MKGCPDCERREAQDAWKRRCDAVVGMGILTMFFVGTVLTRSPLSQGFEFDMLLAGSAGLLAAAFTLRSERRRTA